VAERLIPLAQGSNFRDIGGYVGAGGKHVRWGLIYRSAGQPLLSPSDVAQIQGLGVTQLVDLRSSEERVIAPSKITGIPYTAVGYSMMDMMKGSGNGTSSMRNGVDVYRNFPHFLAPQLKLIFAHLLGDRGPIAYNCSAGQDRTGFTTAIILSVLGVPRATIIEDYHLSTTYRRPEVEMPPLDPASTDPVVKLFAMYQKRPNARTADPLKTADGTPFLAGAFQEIDEKWGSVDAYLIKEIGLTPADLTKLRLLYLE
jgi:protein-tyrosine phosphatase